MQAALDHTVQNYWGNRPVLLATMHGKEAVIGPVLEQELGWTLLVPENFNTDRFGTFSGETEREGSPLETAERKCRAAYEATGHTLVLASEGSFGPHPVIGFVPADEEWLVLKDYSGGLTIRARVVSTETNFAGRLCRTMHEVEQFAGEAGFPDHALILRRDRDDLTGLEKGITGPGQLAASAAGFLSRYGQVWVETDMRAHLNPMRRRVIEQAARKLVELVRSTCPVCRTPGYTVTESRGGLPCAACGLPTRSILAHIYGCERCGHREEKRFPYGKETEQPLYCDACNP